MRMAAGKCMVFQLVCSWKRNCNVTGHKYVADVKKMEQINMKTLQEKCKGSLMVNKWYIVAHNSVLVYQICPYTAVSVASSCETLVFTPGTTCSGTAVCLLQLLNLLTEQMQSPLYSSLHHHRLLLHQASLWVRSATIMFFLVLNF